MIDAPDPGSAERYAYLAEGNARQARKRMAADVLIRNHKEEILLVDPTYKEGWDLPGGMVEANEAPTDAARRELREELGISVNILGMLSIDWDPPRDPWDDQLVVIFDGGTLSRAEAMQLHPCDAEISACAFFPLKDAIAMIHGRMKVRLSASVAALHTRAPQYLERGLPPW